MKTLLERYRVEDCKILGKLTVIERDENTLELAIDDYQETCEDEPFVQTINHTAAKDSLIKVSPLYIIVSAKWFSYCQEEVKLIPKYDRYIVKYTNGGETRLYIGRRFGEGRGSKLCVYREKGKETVYITMPFDPSLGPRYIREEAMKYIDSKIDEIHTVLCSIFDIIDVNKMSSNESDDMLMSEIRSFAVRCSDNHRCLNDALDYRFGTLKTAASKANEDVGVVGKRQDDLRLNLHKFQQMSFKERLRWLLFGE